MDVPDDQTQSFKIDPEVEAVMLRGQHQRHVCQMLRTYLAEVTKHLLAAFPGNAAMIANMIEGEAHRLRSFIEQERRRLREGRRAEEHDGDDRRDAPEVQDGISGVPGVEP